MPSRDQESNTIPKLIQENQKAYGIKTIEWLYKLK